MASDSMRVRLHLRETRVLAVVRASREHVCRCHAAGVPTRVDPGGRRVACQLRQIRPRCSYGSAIWVEVTDAVCRRRESPIVWGR